LKEKQSSFIDFIEVIMKHRMKQSICFHQNVTDLWWTIPNGQYKTNSWTWSQIRSISRLL